jgi:hypothetical protein
MTTSVLDEQLRGRLTCTLHNALPKHPALPLRPAIADLMQLDEQFAEPAGATRALSQIRPAVLLEPTRVVRHDHAVNIGKSGFLHRFQYWDQAAGVTRGAVARVTRRL